MRTPTILLGALLVAVLCAPVYASWWTSGVPVDCTGNNWYWNGVICVRPTCGTGFETRTCNPTTGFGSVDPTTPGTHYCSDGVNADDGNPNTGVCCPKGRYWTGVACIGSAECNPAPCPYLPSNPLFFSTAACVSSTADFGSFGACCSVAGGKYGQTPYFDYKDRVGAPQVSFY